jgi:hypothetical protein
LGGELGSFKTVTEPQSGAVNVAELSLVSDLASLQDGNNDLFLFSMTFSTGPVDITTLTFSGGIDWSVAVPQGTGATLSDETSATPSFVPDLTGEYEVELAVSDGLVDSEPVTLTILAEGPVADAGDAQLDVGVGETVTLDGSGSTSCTGDPLTYSWVLTTPNGSSAELSDPSAVTPTFIADVAGEYTAELTVYDGTQEASDAVIIRTKSTAALRCGDLVSSTIGEEAEVDHFTFDGQEAVRHVM